MPTDTGPSGEVSAERTSVSEVEEKQVGHTLIDNVVANFNTRPTMHKAMCLPSALTPKLTRYTPLFRNVASVVVKGGNQTVMRAQKQVQV